MSDEWPPDWEDLAEEDLPPEADEARLTEVTALLAAAPMPVLPDAVAARIGAALTAEAASRAVLTTEAAAGAATPPSGGDAPLDAAAPNTAAPGPPVPGDGARIVKPVRSPAWPRRSGGGTARRTARTRSLTVAAVVTALALAGLGYGLSRGGMPAASSSGTIAGAGPVPVEQDNATPGKTPTSAPGPKASAQVPGISAPAPVNSSPYSSGTSRSTPANSASPPDGDGSSGPASSPGRSPGSSASGSPTATTPGPTASAPSTSTTPTPTPTPSASTTPTPTASSLPALPPLSGSPNASPSRSPHVSWVVVASGTNYLPATLAAQAKARLNGSGLPGSAPSATQQACATHVIGNAVPKLFDQATFQGSPAYIIATASEAWVVGTGCSATALDVLDTVLLPG